MAGLKLEGLKKSYGAVDVIHGVDLEIRQGEFIVFVGPSGCGKSTLLRMIAGTGGDHRRHAGNRRHGGQRRAAVQARHRHGVPVLCALPAHDGLRQHGLRLRIAGQSNDEIDERVTRRPPTSCSSTDYLDRLPKALSGGQRQRVAIGRAICRDPKVFLFDEPLSNLDAALRVATRIEIAKLNESMPETTMIYVTHDQVEAMTLADRIVVCRKV
jgi:alpha-glucoside transport system ATP-binding protein